jgi:hypothetical protein
MHVWCHTAALDVTLKRKKDFPPRKDATGFGELEQYMNGEQGRGRTVCHRDNLFTVQERFC